MNLLQVLAFELFPSLSKLIDPPLLGYSSLEVSNLQQPLSILNIYMYLKPLYIACEHSLFCSKIHERKKANKQTEASGKTECNKQSSISFHWSSNTHTT